MSGPAAADILLRLDGVVAGYAAPVVGPQSFTLAPGERLGIAGPNGSGKSTLLRAITGEARLFAGGIARAPGLRVSHQSQGFESLAGFPLSGRELLALTGASAQGLPPWLADRLDRRLEVLSGGQMQLLRLWACLMAPADLVLLDEPTNNLDREGVAFLAGELLGLQPQCALVLVSHDSAFLRRVCTSVIALD